MTEMPRRDSDRSWHLWKGPALIWLALTALFVASLGWAYLPLRGDSIAGNLLIAALMITLLVTFLMDLRNARALIRIVAAAGLFWSMIMFVLTFTDYLSRHY